MTFTPNYINTYESILIDTIASCLWLPSGPRLLSFTIVGQLFFLYYKVRGAYSNPEAKLQKLIESYPIPVGEKKIVIVTGANTGIGYETARVLAKAGYKVILACRNESKAQKAIKKIRSLVKGCDIEFAFLDLSSFTSVKEFAKEYSSTRIPLDMLINNAAVMALPNYIKTKDGFEMQFQVNYLSPFLLTYLLAPRLKEAKDSKVINVSSIAHFGAGNCDFSTIHDKLHYSRTFNYCKSKAAGYMSTISFQKRLGPHGVQVYAAHPGVVATELWRNVPFLDTFISFVYSTLFKTPLQGALTILRLALTSNAILLQNLTSRYFANELPMSPHYYTRNDESQEELWRETCEVLGVDDEI